MTSSKALRRRPAGNRAPAVLVGLGLLVAAATAPPVHAQQPPPPEASAGDYRDTADDVLARQEFKRPEPTVLERVRDWLDDRLDSLINGLTGGGAGSVVGWVVLVVATGSLIWFLTRLGRTVRPDPGAAPAIRIDQGRSPDEWRAAADRLEEEGSWKDALRCRYRALLGDLVRAGVVDDVPGRTSGEYRHEVERAVPDSAAAVGEATELFEWAWYADRPTGPDEATRFRTAAAEAVAASARSDRAPRSPAGV